MNPAGKIGDPGRLRTISMGARKQGVIIPEVMEAFGVSKDSARRYVLRLCREGRLERTRERRRRPDIYNKAPGAGGVVYRTTREGERWAGLQRRRERRGA